MTKNKFVFVIIYYDKQYILFIIELTKVFTKICLIQAEIIVILVKEQVFECIIKISIYFDEIRNLRNCSKKSI